MKVGFVGFGFLVGERFRVSRFGALPQTPRGIPLRPQRLSSSHFLPFDEPPFLGSLAEELGLADFVDGGVGMLHNVELVVDDRQSVIPELCTAMSPRLLAEA
jgi:hypothetical protein